jgi:hypothetical protein
MFQPTEQRNLGTLTPSRSIAFKRLSWMLFSLRTRTHSVFREISLTASGFPFLANRRCELKRRAFRWARLTSLHRLPPRSSGHSTIPCPSPQLGGVERVEGPLHRFRLSPDVRIPYGDENRARLAGPRLDAQDVREVCHRAHRIKRLNPGDVARVVLLACTQSAQVAHYRDADAHDG